MNAKPKQKVDLNAPPTAVRTQLRWVDQDSRGMHNLAVEDADEKDLINLQNPAPVVIHRHMQSDQLRSVIKIKQDTSYWQKKYPSRIFQADKGFIEPYVAEKDDPMH